MRGASMKTFSLVLLFTPLFAPLFVSAQRGPAAADPPRQTQSDDYTRYELLEPGSGKFRILYEVTVTTPGATQFFNAIRQGSVASDESVFDMMTGAPLTFDKVGRQSLVPAAWAAVGRPIRRRSTSASGSRARFPMTARAAS